MYAQSCLTLCDHMDCSLPGSSVHGIVLVRILEWVSISSSRGSSYPGIKPRFLHWQSDSLPLNYITTGIRLIKSLALGNQVNLQPLFSPGRCVCFEGLKVPTCLSCDWFPWQSAPLLLCPSPAFQRSSSLHKLRCG